MKNKLLYIAMTLGVVGVFINEQIVFAGAIIALTAIFLKEGK